MLKTISGLPLQFLKKTYALYCMFTFLTGLLMVFPGVLVAMVLPRQRGGNLVIRLSRFWANYWFFVIGVKHRNEVLEHIDDQRQYVFVANHISYLDIPIIFKAIPKANFRVLGKMEMSKVPVFGLLYRLAVVLVDRSSPENRARSISRLKTVLNHNTSIFIFPEGTFNETGAPLKSFFDGAFRMAIETQTPVKPILFLDAIDRLHYRSLWCFTPGISRALILPEIAVEGLSMKDVPQLRAQVYNLMEAALIQYRKSP